MIRLLPLEGRANYEAILELYYYMVAMATPFCPEDIFPSDTFHEQGNLQMPAYSVKDFYQRTGKRPRRRTKDYKILLDRYSITETPKTTVEERRKNDALLAKQIIRGASKGKPANKSLYNFLYKGLPSDDFHVHKDQLQLLLTSYMNPEAPEQANLCFEAASPNDLDEVFRYKKFADSPEAVQLIALLEVPVCPYCNRSYTTTVSAKGIRQGQFDHYRNKSDHPWFALSLRNLIPSCGFCNQIKGDRSDRILYPYQEGMGRHYRFRTRPVKGMGYLMGTSTDLDEFEVVAEIGPVPTTKSHIEHIKKSLETFHLEALYQNHQEHIAWIFRQRYIFPDAYLEQLCSGPLKLFSSVQEVRDMLYMRHLSPDRWGEHPLSKLTHDIDEEITELEIYFSKNVK